MSLAKSTILFSSLLLAVSVHAGVRMGLTYEGEDTRSFANQADNKDHFEAIQGEIDEQNAIGRFNVWARLATKDQQTEFIPRNVFVNVFTNMDTNISIGTQVRRWGYGYGFHLLSPWADANNYGLEPTNGQPMIMMEHYGISDTQTLVCGRNTDWHQHEWLGDSYCAVNWANSGNNFDWQVSAMQLGNDYRIGGGLQQAVGDAWQFWQEVAWQNAVERYTIEQTQIQTETHLNNALYLIGAKWSHPSGLTLTAEFWHNGLATTGQTWDDALNQASSSPLVVALLQSNDLGQDYGLLRANVSDNDWDASIVLIKSFADAAWLQQLEIKVILTDVNVLAGVQHFTGSQQSHWRQQPLENRFYGGLEWHF